MIGYRAPYHHVRLKVLFLALILFCGCNPYRSRITNISESMLPSSESKHASVSGIVTHKGHEPIPLANIVLFSEWGEQVYRTRTDDRGHFAFLEVVGNQTYTLVAQLFLMSPALHENIQVSNGKHVNVAVILELEPGAPEYIE